MNITENIFKNNVPTSMIYNCKNNDNYDNYNYNTDIKFNNNSHIIYDTHLNF